MKQKRPILLTIIAGLTSIILGLLGNMFITILFSTSPPPADIVPYVHFIPVLFGVVAFFSIVLSVVLLPSENVSTPSVQTRTGSDVPTDAVAFSCPVCKHMTLHVHGRSGNDLILICSTCSKVTRLTYNGSTVEKLVVPGLIVIGTLDILNHLGADPIDLLDLFSNFFF